MQDVTEKDLVEVISMLDEWKNCEPYYRSYQVCSEWDIWSITTKSIRLGKIATGVGHTILKAYDDLVEKRRVLETLENLEKKVFIEVIEGKQR